MPITIIKPSECHVSINPAPFSRFENVSVMNLIILLNGQVIIRQSSNKMHI